MKGEVERKIYRDSFEHQVKGGTNILRTLIDSIKEELLMLKSQN